ncbi:MAG: hypothetical protein IPJ34_20745 [Myxococcales bacterium]|nr:hypothetical protein [Myxococcales bacterium]
MPRVLSTGHAFAAHSLSGYKERVERTLQKAGVDVVRVLWQPLALD